MTNLFLVLSCSICTRSLYLFFIYFFLISLPPIHLSLSLALSLSLSLSLSDGGSGSGDGGKNIFSLLENTKPYLVKRSDSFLPTVLAYKQCHVDNSSNWGCVVLQFYMYSVMYFPHLPEKLPTCKDSLRLRNWLPRLNVHISSFDHTLQCAMPSTKPVWRRFNTAKYAVLSTPFSWYGPRVNTAWGKLPAWASKRQRSDINMSSTNWRVYEFCKLLIMWETVMQSH